MKLRLMFFCFVLFIINGRLISQQYNPFVDLGDINPKPLLPAEFGGKGTISFRVGNSGSSNLILQKDREMGLVIGLSNGVPDNIDPLKAIRGEWASYFSWTYNPTANSYQGKQIKEIKAMTSGTIIIDYKVKRNIRESTSSNGFNVNLQPPPYANGENLTGDDSTGKYTFVKATDYGDAPISYGAASADIDLYKLSNGSYERFVMLGDTVDYETTYNGSLYADFDDKTGLSDENGVKFPAIYPGTTVIIPVITIIRGGSFHYLNAWIDWNGDGDFSDSGERITLTNTIVTGLGRKTTNLSVKVPANAKPGRTYARFRFGANTSLPNGHATYGEVEDYAIDIFLNNPSLALEKSGVWNDMNNNGRAEVGETITFTFKARNTGNTSLTNVVLNDLMLDNSQHTVVPNTLLPGEIGTVVIPYVVNQSDINTGSVYNKAIVYAKSNGDVDVSAESIDSNPLKGKDPNYNQNCPTCNYTSISLGNEITGFAWEDTNKNGIFDPSEPALSGQKIILYSASNLKVDSTLSDQDGKYRLTYIENGDYYLMFIPNSGYTFTLEKLGEQLGNSVNNVNGFGTTESFSLASQTILGPINAGLFIGSLPISWVKVEASRIGNTNKLNWEVASEKNVEKYIIYRKIDEESKFKAIGETKSSTVSENLRNNYTYLDYSANENGNYSYYVENVDRDAKTSKSKIASLSIFNNVVIDVFPNPASNYINVSIPDGDASLNEFKLYDLGGKLIKNFLKDSAKSGVKSHQYDISDIIPGRYIVKLKMGDTEIDKRLIIIK
jgi:uncharacterized repeat protein (TIGR01451 family)